MLARNNKRATSPMIQLSLWRSFLIVLAAALAVTTPATTPSAFAKDDLGPGCAPDRPAIAHHAGGVLAGTDEEAPIPCSTATGFRTSEASIVVTNKGTVLFQPAIETDSCNGQCAVNNATGLPIGVLRSVTQGATWDFIKPSVSPDRSTAIDMNLWVDRETGRVFWSNDLVEPIGPATTQRVDHSDDDGQTWVRTAALPGFYFDHTQIFSGPPPEKLEPLMRGYPNVVYVVTSGGFPCAKYDFCGAHITRSLDGGSTWEPSVALAYPSDCPAPGVLPTGGYGLNGVVGRDGTIYVPFTPCEEPIIDISQDEGQTWQVVKVADIQTTGWGQLSLGMDKHENLYAAWTSSVDRLPYLSISRDHGLHWSAPMMIGAPGVNEAAEPLVLAGAKGQVVVTYYGSKNAPLPFPAPCGQFSLLCAGYQNEIWDTYVTETFNALDGNPLFWSATLNDPAHSTWYGASPSSIRIDETGFVDGDKATNGNGLQGRLDYFGATMALDGTPWVGFAQECPNGLPVPGNPNCPSTLTGNPNDGLFGLVGRLVRPAHDH